MTRFKMILLLFGLSGTLQLSAQALTLQFMQTEYSIKELQMLDESTGYAVGASHWDRALKKFRGTILKTTDGGIAWKSLDVPFTNGLWDLQFTEPSRGWAAGESGLLLYTLDAGESWNRKDIGISLDIKSLSFTDATNGWLVANEVVQLDPFGNPEAWRGRIWHSSDEGESWSEQSLPSDAGLIHSIYFKNCLEGWAIGVRNQEWHGLMQTRCAAYYTSDGGDSWIEKFSPDLELVFTDMDFPDEKHGFMVGFKTSLGESDGLIFRTVDGGEHWERRGEGDALLWEVAFMDSLRGYALGADYYSAGGPPIYRTIDGGRSWENIHLLEHNNQGLYGLSVLENCVMGLGDEGFRIRSVDPWGEIGMAYEEQLFVIDLIDTLYHFEDLFFINPSKGWAVGSKSVSSEAWSQVILTSSDGGAHWKEQYSFEIDPVSAFAFRLNAVQFVSETTGWAVGVVNEYGDAATSAVLFTNDGGTTWSEQAVGVSEGQMVDLFFLDDQNGWALTNRNSYPEDHIQVLKTTNGGVAWEKVSTGQEGNITVGFGIRSGSLYFQDKQTGWILGASCELLKTEDGGESWRRVELPESWTNTYDIAFFDEQNGFICGERNFVTNNGGESWREGLAYENNFTDLCFTETHGWMVGEHGNLFYSMDRGNSWEKVNQQATHATLKSVSFPNPAIGWAAGVRGSIIRIDASSLRTESLRHTNPSSPKLYQNRPNPFSQRTEIGFYLVHPGKIELAVYDLNGRMVASLMEEHRTEGSHTIIWNGKDDHNNHVAPGLYIYRLSTDKGSSSRSLVVF